MSILGLLYIQSENLVHTDVLKQHASLVDRLLILDKSSGTQIRHLIHSLSLPNVDYVNEHQDHRLVTATLAIEMNCEWLIHLHEHEVLWIPGVSLRTVLTHLPEQYDALAMQMALTRPLATPSETMPQSRSLITKLDTLPLKDKHPWSTRVQRLRPYMYYDNGVQHARQALYVKDLILVDFHESLSTLTPYHQDIPADAGGDESKTHSCLRDVRYHRDLLVSRSGSWPGDRACWFHTIVPYEEVNRNQEDKTASIRAHVESYFKDKHDQHGSLLRDILSSHGSTKESSLHTYGGFYDHLWHKKRTTVTTVFELAMGQRSGTTTAGNTVSPLEAALRSWKEYFPQATIYGAAENPEQLFYDQGIKCYQISPQSKEAFLILWSYIPDVRFDLAFLPFQRTLAETRDILLYVLPRVKKGGYCIIEQVPDELEETCSLYQEELRYQVQYIQFVSLPGHANSVDNNLLLIIR